MSDLESVDQSLHMSISQTETYEVLTEAEKSEQRWLIS